MRTTVLRLPKASTQVALPLLSYTTLAGALAATIKLMRPFAGWGVALTGMSVCMPVALTLGQLALLGGAGVAKSLGGTETSDPTLQRLAADAAAAVGVPAPRVFEVPSAEPNAFAASGLGGRATAVAVTSGLRQILTQEELAAVLAHEMGHLRHRDAMRNVHIAAASAGLGGIYQLGRWLMDAELRDTRTSGRTSHRKKSKDKEKGSTLPVALALMAGGALLEGSAHLVRLTASRHSEIRADKAAAAAYGAQTIIDALRKIDAAAARRPADLRTRTGKAFAFAMISDGPTAATAKERRGAGGFLRTLSKMGEALRTHPTLEQRISALETAAAEGSVPARRAGSWWW